jgi:hypothetical protein
MKIMEDGVVKMKEKLLKVLRKKKITEAELTYLLIDPYAIFREVAVQRLKEIVKEEQK